MVWPPMLYLTPSKIVVRSSRSAMPYRPLRLALLFAPLLVAVVLVGCSSRAPKVSGVKTPTAPSQTMAPLSPAIPWVVQAHAAATAGDFILAARHYLDAAQGQPATLRLDYQLKAVEALLKGALSGGAKDILATITPTPELPATLVRKKAILEAQIALLENHPDEALTTLDNAPAANVAPDLELLTQQIRAESSLQTSDVSGAIKAFSALTALESSAHENATYQNRLWQLLTTQSLASLSQLQQEATSEPLAGWLALAQLHLARQLPQTTIDTDINHWKRDHPFHPVSEALLATLAPIQQVTSATT
ncbi:MAG: LppC family lipoprotein, partial [Halothiobacillaceae bacterium]